MGAFEWHRITVDGRDAEVGEAACGDEVTICFVHGFASTPRGADRRSLERLMASPVVRENNCRVIAPQLPGFGGTTPLPDGFTLQDYADWYIACLEEMNVRGPVILFGESLGGAVASLVAARRPDPVDALFVFNSVGGPMPGRNRVHWLAGVMKMAAPRRGAVPQWISSIVDAAMVLRHPRTMWRLSSLIINANLSDDLAAVAAARIPALAVFSRQDPVVLEHSSDTFRTFLQVEPLFITGDHRSFIESHPAIELLLCDLAQAIREGTYLGQSPAERLGAELLRDHGIELVIQERDGSVHVPGEA